MARPPRPKPDRYVRQADAARALGINRATIHYHVARGHLTLANVAGVRFVTVASLNRLLRQRKEP